MAVANTELRSFVREENKKVYVRRLCFYIAFCFSLIPIVGMAQNVPAPADTIPADTTISEEDSTRNLGYRRNTRPTYNIRDRYGDPFSNRLSPSPLIPDDPTMIEVVPQLDTADTTMNYSIYERLGDVDYRAPTNLNQSQYSRIQDQRIQKDYWKSRSAGLDGESAVSGRRLIPPIYTTPVFDRLFGGSFVDIRPNGFVTLDFGGRFQRIDNPSIPIRQQRNGNFEFDQQISLNVTGKIGTKLAVTANFDNNNSFDFQNNVKVEYTGEEHEIIKKIELGSVSLPVSNSLITGSQSLFGLKTQLQFGRLFVTSVASVQRGSSDVVNVKGGGTQTQEFEIRGSEYDENRHFFLGHFFRNNYESWLQNLPQVLSGLNINRVEVYVLNRNNSTDALRNVVGFMDLGEGQNVYRENNPQVTPLDPSQPTNNDANGLYENLSSTQGLRDITQVDQILTGQYNFENATDYQKITSARKLNDSEFTFNSELGFLSLNRKLSNDEILAVAFEYTYQGRRYQVGELTEDYQSLADSAAIFLKLLRPAKISTEVPTWDLMMKNVYSLNASQISDENFQFRVIYRDDNSGVDNPSLHEGAKTKDVPLIRLLGLDNLNQNNDRQPDGNFDFVEGATINPDLGTVIFPVLEPFGSTLRTVIEEESLKSKYVYSSLYETTKADAELVTTKNKFYLVGSYTAGSSSDITLPGFNIAEGSVTVLAGNTPLTEGVDYTVDYSLGKVTITNEGVLNSGKDIQISYEKADLFNFQQRSFFGTRLDYRINENFNLGATVLHLNERPLVTRVNIGDEPTKNTKYGFDINFSKESRFLTRMVDLLPIVQTKEPSSFTFNAEFAQLIPGTSNIVLGDGTSYIDDFENSITPYNLRSWQNWFLASTPSVVEEERSGFKRAKIAWYIVDNTVFYTRNASLRPDNVPDFGDGDNSDKNIYERPFLPQDIFVNQNREVAQLNQQIFDIAYFPEERGPYNFNPNLTPEGRLRNPSQNWGGITRPITSDVDFDKTNIEYIEFWMLDPFVNGERGVVRDGVVNQNNTTGGRLIFNLGSVSEDVIPDGRHFFENGLSDDYSSDNVTSTQYGRVTTQQFLTDYFNNTDADARSNQDVGLDGVRNDGPGGEAEFFSDLISRMPAAAQQAIQDDPSADNFQYYLGDVLDEADAQIVERYKNFNGQEGNTPVLENSNTNYTPSGTQKPDNEDLNRDNTLSDLEEYYSYEVNLRPGQLQVGSNYIVDKVIDPNDPDATWYLFRIPVRQPQSTVGNIEGFKSIRYMRTYLTGFSQPVVLRMAKFQLVGSQWRRYNADLKEGGLYEYAEDYDPNFTISVVNIEENSSINGQGSPYVLPPGVIRDRDNTSPIERRLNEQSLKLEVENLKDGDARAAYKNLTLDLINYGSIRMFLHAESLVSRDSSVTAFLRLGTDFNENYYEIEVPLAMSPANNSAPEVVWPDANEIDFDLSNLYEIKAARNRSSISNQQVYSQQVGKYRVTVRGNPDISSVQTVMIGIRNPTTVDRAPQSVTLWANELRVGDFDRTSGWAVNARVNTKLADLANITASARHMTYGFGSIQSSISDRAREETTEFDVSANVNVEKMLPRKLGLQVPMFVSYETARSVPQFDPKNPDIPLDASLQAFGTQEERSNYLDIVTTQSVQRSLNFTNVRKIKLREDASSHFFDLSNFSFNYLYSDVESSNLNTAIYQQRVVQGGIGYNYTFPQVSVQPFGNIKAFDSPWMALIKDFNFSPLPTAFNARADLRRSFVKTLLRSADLTPLSEAYYEKAFTFNRIYDLQWNLTNSLTLDYGSQAYAIIDEPEGEIDSESKRQTIINNLKKLGRLKNFDQNVAATYSVPFDKLPLTSWLNADVRYGAGYTWQAGAFDPLADISPSDTLGNIIQNNQDRSLNGRINMTDLYNKVKFLKQINTPSRGRGRPQRPTARRNEEDSTAAKAPADPKFLKGFLRILMSLRSIDVTYTQTNNTLVPGFMPTPTFFGMSPGFEAPGLAFVLGSQDPEIFNAVRDNWLAPSSALTTAFQQASMENLGVRASIEPFQDFKIQVDFKRTNTANFQRIFSQDSSTVRTGSYSLTYFTLPTAFVGSRPDNTSELFENFEAYRAIIRQRLQVINPAYSETSRYNANSQDVLIPAFLAAYSGQDVNEVRLNPFPKMPMPNWRVDYNGLPRVFGGLGEIFQQFALSHAYTSTYSVNNFTSSGEYTTGLDLSEDITNYPLATYSQDSVLVPKYVIQQVTITERFSPLIGVNVRTRGRLTARISYDIERSLALNMSNAQITELNSQGVTVNLGLTKSQFTLPFRVKGETITLENDLTFNFAMSLKDTETIQRKIEEENVVTNGNLNFQFRPTIDYRINERLNMQIYFARTVNDPKVTNSYKRTTTEFGTQLRFNLAQ